jgi:Txe/YoeB family toxin of Txe-Axe toxin-antitoxin module
MAGLSHKINLVFGSDFLYSFSQVPSRIQTKVNKVISGFKNNPSATGYNFESLHTKDSHLCSLRIDQDYRGIMYKTDKGETLILLWVDKHENAYAWAQNKVFRVHPETGSLQMIDLADVGMADENSFKNTQAEDNPNDLFAAFRDRDLVKLGIPEIVVPFIRTIKTEDDLEAAEVKLPSEAWEALFLLYTGESLQDVYNTVVVPKMKVDTEDVESSLQQADSQRRFVVITDDESLKDMLTYPLDAWRVFLHPSQRKIVKMQAQGPVRVLGGAGTGKTVVAMHRAKYLAEEVFSSSTDKILFTTYTKNLAADIKENLKKICSTEQLKRIDVVHIDGWVSEFLRKRSYTYSYVSNTERKDFWEEAILSYEGTDTFPLQFFMDEWDQIIQQQGITTIKGYFKAKRIGRGRSLRVQQRKEIWPVFEEYRNLLDVRMKYEYADAARTVTHMLQESKDILPYRAVVVDEAQDLDAVTFRLLLAISENHSSNKDNTLFITGDAHQRIYGQKIVLSHCGIEIRGRSMRLKVNYRTPEEIRGWAQHILDGREIDDLDGGSDSLKGYHSLLHGENPDIRKFDTYGQEIDTLTEYINSLISGGAAPEAICIAVRTNDLVIRYQSALESRGMQLYQIQAHDERSSPGIRIATMHRVKGLEFNHIICPGVNENILPLASVLATQDNEDAKKDFELKERSLFFVAVTRARKSVLISSFGTSSSYLT